MTISLDKLEKLAKDAAWQHGKRQLSLTRYEHGGGRLITSGNEDQDLVADFYDTDNREFYAACDPATILKLLAVVKATKAFLEAPSATGSEDECYDTLKAAIAALDTP